MQNDCRNIYRAARNVAGLTQERAAEMLGISVRSLADYETGVRTPPNEVVNDMVMCYNSQLLAIQHLRASAEAARKILPEVRAMRLPEAALTLIDAIYDFADDRLDRELIDIARDGVISEDERPRFERVVEKIRTITAAAMAVSCATEK
mgnify:CR=1 FL=1